MWRRLVSWRVLCVGVHQRRGDRGLRLGLGKGGRRRRKCFHRVKWGYYKK
nr:MAG TPA: hypothetical protein [Caudoviricetes sp.]